MYKIAVLIVTGLAVLGTGDAKGTIIEFHVDGIIQEGDDFDLVEIFDDATVVMVGGTVRRFQTYETSVLNISGGVVGGSNKHIVLAYGASTVNMGGAFDSSTVNIYGENFVFTSPGATLTGNWADGTPFSIYIRAGVDKVNLIPEPGTLALFGLAAVPLIRKRRRLKTLLYVLLFSSLGFSQVAQAVDTAGYAYAWGYNEYGQCGNGTL